MINTSTLWLTICGLIIKNKPIYISQYTCFNMSLDIEIIRKKTLDIDLSVV